MNARSIIQNSLRGAQYFIRRFQEDRCSEIAAALVYMSLFALVPLITVVFAVGSAIPTSGNIEQQIQQFLVQNLVPEASRDVADYLTTFSEQAKNLTGFGVAILLVTAVLMLRNVERAFNNIWRTRKNRSPISSFLLYWAVLSLAPLLLGIGLGIQAYLYAAANAIAGFDTLGISVFLLSLLPFVHHRYRLDRIVYGGTQLRRASATRFRRRFGHRRGLHFRESGVCQGYRQFQLHLSLWRLCGRARVPTLVIRYLDFGLTGSHIGS